MIAHPESRIEALEIRGLPQPASSEQAPHYSS